MSSPHSDLSLSDDEVFVGNLTHKEIKKRLGQDHRQTVASVQDTRDSFRDYNKGYDVLDIIETHSEPDNISKQIAIPEFCDLTIDDRKPLNKDDNEVNCTSTVLPFDPVLKSDCHTENKCVDKLSDVIVILDVEQENSVKQYVSPLNSNCHKDNNSSNYSTPIKIINSVTPSVEKKHLTPLNKCDHKDVFTTPSNELKVKPIIFKTPANPGSSKKQCFSSTKKTPKSKAYQHIESPVAYYIKNCPQVPLVRDVHPKKPLPGGSPIPKFVKSTTQISSNKENVRLPSVAYKSAKCTKMIDNSSDVKLPESHFAKKILSSLPRPTVIKHQQRENSAVRKVLLAQPEDSFADLSLHQADISVCTKKSAFKPK